jgi:hypothetical protein
MTYKKEVILNEIPMSISVQLLGSRHYINVQSEMPTSFTYGRSLYVDSKDLRETLARVEEEALRWAEEVNNKIAEQILLEDIGFKRID